MDPQSPSVWFNSGVISPPATSIHAIASAALYGKGLFTTVAIINGEPFLWEKHWRRLRESAGKLSIDLSEFSEGSTRTALDEIISKNAVSNGRARITFFDESSSSIWQFEEKSKTSLLIISADQRPVPDDLKATISTSRISSRSFLAGIKSCNYLENILAINDAKERGFDEAIRLNERDEITSGCMANVFWLRGGRLFTPSLKTGCLPGTTREFILENLECDEVESPEEVIHHAEATFFTSAGLGVVKVNELSGKKLTAGDHPILQLIPESLKNTNIREYDS
ncbi:MAG: aminotransferase class IV [Acidobacteriota bacterium]